MIKLREVSDEEREENLKMGEPWMKRCVNCDIPLHEEEIDEYGDTCSTCVGDYLANEQEEDLDEDERFDRYLFEECISID